MLRRHAVRRPLFLLGTFTLLVSVTNCTQSSAQYFFAGPDGSVPEDSALSADASPAERDAADALDAVVAADAGTGAPDAAPPDSGTPEVRYIGRFDMSDGAGPRTAWPASRVVLRFEGAALDATLLQQNGYSGGPSYLDVLIDGVLQSAPLSVSPGSQTLAVARGLGAGAHTVELVKRTEARFGTLQFQGFSYPLGGRLLPPPPPRAHRIEVLGNSAVTGYGVEGSNSDCPGSASVDNARKSAPALAADALDADLSFLGYSGRGINRNYDGGQTDTFPTIWQRTRPEAAGAWNTAQFVPDAFVLIATGVDAEGSDAELSAGYTNFVGTVRSTYPNAHLFLVVPAALTDDYPAGQRTRSRVQTVLQAIAAQRLAAGDSKVSAHAMTEYAVGQLSGCDYHPGAALQQQMAVELSGWIRTRLGW